MALVAQTQSGFSPANLCRRIVKNSVTLNVGDCVKSYTAGIAEAGVAGADILGIVIGFENVDGSQIRPSAVSKSTSSFAGSITQLVAASDNQTNAKQLAVICHDRSVTWSAAVNGTINTTATSGLPSCGIDIDSSNTNVSRVLESTATRTAATLTNFVTSGNNQGTSTDQNDVTRLLVRISASELSSSAKG